ncbi:unnamed protein product [Boreogadus saida]
MQQPTPLSVLAILEGHVARSCPEKGEGPGEGTSSKKTATGTHLVRAAAQESLLLCCSLQVLESKAAEEFSDLLSTPFSKLTLIKKLEYRKTHNRLNRKMHFYSNYRDTRG